MLATSMIEETLLLASSFSFKRGSIETQRGRYRLRGKQVKAKICVSISHLNIIIYLFVFLSKV